MVERSVSRRQLLQGGALAGTAGLAGCAGAGAILRGGEPSNTEKGPIRFGGTVSETGDLAAEGQATAEGYRLWKEYMNEEHGGIAVGGRRRPISLTLYDDESSKRRAITLYQRLIHRDDVDFLLGPYSSGITIAIAGIATRNNIPVISTNGAANKIYKLDYENVFGVLSPGSQYLPPIIDAVMNTDTPPKRAGLIAANDIFSQVIADATVRRINRINGLELVMHTTIPAGTSDLSNPITNAMTSNVDFLLGATHTKEAIAATRSAQRQGFNPRAMGYAVGPDTTQFIQTLGPVADGVFGTVQWSRDLSISGGPYFGTAQDYVQKYREYIPNAAITYRQAMATAGGLSYQRAIQEYAQSTETEAVKEGLNRMNVNTALGRLGFDDRNELERINLKREMYVTQVQNGSIEVVYPSDVGSATMNYPVDY